MESQMIEIVDPDSEKVDEDIYVELEYDLRKLFKEARAKKGDPISKRIVGNIDDWLRSELEIAIDEYEAQNPRFEIKLTEEDEKND
jgi:ATP-dependent Lon protease